MNLFIDNPPCGIGIAIQETDYFITGDNPLITNEACLEFPVLDIGKDSLGMATESGRCFGDGEEVCHDIPKRNLMLSLVSCDSEVVLPCSKSVAQDRLLPTSLAASERLNLWYLRHSWKWAISPKSLSLLLASFIMPII